MAKPTQKLTTEYKQAAIIELLAANLYIWDRENENPSKDEGPDKFKEQVKLSWQKLAAGESPTADGYRRRAVRLLEDLAWAGLSVSTSGSKSEGELVDALDFLLTIPATRVVELPKPYADA